MNEVIKITNLNKIYKSRGAKDFYALKKVNLTIYEGEFVMIRGRSGSGKSTLLNMIGCIDSFNSGEYVLKNEHVLSMNDEKRAKLRNKYFGFVFQEFYLSHNQTVLYNVMLPLLFTKISLKKAKEKALTVLDNIGISDLAKRKVRTLSGGQKQRVVVARALVNDPLVLLADEPTGSLDSQTARELMELLAQKNAEGVTILMVSHDNSMVSYCSRVVDISDGQIVEPNSIH